MLILGSSHSVMGIAPHLLSERAVNLAGATQDLYYSCALARRYVPQMPKLRVLVLEAEIWGWQALTERSVEQFRMPQYYFGFGIPPLCWSALTL